MNKKDKGRKSHEIRLPLPELRRHPLLSSPLSPCPLKSREDCHLHMEMMIMFVCGGCEGGEKRVP